MTLGMWPDNSRSQFIYTVGCYQLLSSEDNIIILVSERIEKQVTFLITSLQHLINHGSV